MYCLQSTAQFYLYLDIDCLSSIILNKLSNKYNVFYNFSYFKLRYCYCNEFITISRNYEKNGNSVIISGVNVKKSHKM